MTKQTPWQLEGPPESERRPIIGDCHEPDGDPLGVVLVAHGFKGYKDYGMFPRIAETLASAGFLAHRFNFSHSGMTNDIETFERPDLFERDTWGRQVADYRRVIEALAIGELAGAGLPFVMFGHSRGGATALLTAGRLAGAASAPQPAGIVTAAAPGTCNPLDADQQALMRQAGYLESPSSRTGQVLRIGLAWLMEQIDDPEAHDIPTMTARTRCPILVVHGADDPTVPAGAADDIKAAAGGRATVLVIPDCDHVFNTPNPLAPDAPASDQLTEMLDATVEFATSMCGGS
jgi:dienelactone hydrolase